MARPARAGATEAALAEQQAALGELKMAAAALTEGLALERRQREAAAERSAEALRREAEARAAAAELATQGQLRELRQGLQERPGRAELEAAVGALRREVAEVSARAAANAEGLAAAARRSDANAGHIEVCAGPQSRCLARLWCHLCS